LIHLAKGRGIKRVGESYTSGVSTLLIQQAFGIDLSIDALALLDFTTPIVVYSSFLKSPALTPPGRSPESM
jgi:hypothetical protein